MPVYRGSSEASAFYVGSQEVSRIYRGSSLVWEAGGGGPTTYSILLVVGDSSSLTTGDTNVRNYLQANSNYSVTVVSDTDTEPSSSSYDAAVILESVSSGDIGGKYSTVSNPVLVCEGAIWDAHGLTTADGSTSQTTTQWNVVSGTAISGGLSGNVTVHSSSQNSHNAASDIRADDAVVTARLPSDTSRATVFYLNPAQGHRRAGTDEVIEGKRVAFGLSNNGAAVWQSGARTLFQAALDWMLS